jgi:elongation factor Ts
MKNFVFISPNFPANYWMFCRELKNNGLRVLGIGDCPYEGLSEALRASLDDYYRVGSLESYDEVNRAVEQALRKAGINPAHADSDDHIQSNTAKGWLTAEQAQVARDIRANVPAQALQAINEKKVEMIAQGRMQKFLKESTLVEQAYIMSENKELVKDILKKAAITVTGFRRVTLNQE